MVKMEIISPLKAGPKIRTPPICVFFDVVSDISAIHRLYTTYPQVKARELNVSFAGM
jgi:hypothetical protein